MGSFTDLLGQPDDLASDPLATPAVPKPKAPPPTSQFGRMLQADPGNLAGNLLGATQTTPDAHAKAVENGKVLDIPPDVASRNAAETDKMARLQRWRDALNDAPKMSKLLAEDPDIAKLAADEIELLSKNEKTLTAWESFKGGVDITQGSIYSTLEATGEAFGLDDLTAFGREGRVRNEAEAAQYGKRTRFFDIDSAGTAGSYVKETAAEQIPLMAGPMAGGLGGAAAGFAVGGPIGATIGGIIGAFIPSLVLGVGEVQSGIKEKDPDAVAPGYAFGAGVLIAALDSALPGKVGSTLVRLLGREGTEEVLALTARRLATEAGKSATLEGTTEVVQEVIGEVAAAQATGQEIDTKQLAEQAVEAFVAGFLMGGTIDPVVQVAGRMRDNRAKAVETKSNTEIVDALIKGTADSKLRERNPDAFSAVMAAQTQGTPVETFYVPATAIAELYQSGAGAFDDDPLNQIEGLREQLTEALAVGGDVEISAADYLTHIAPTELHGRLKNDIRAARDGWSVNDAKEYAEDPSREADLSALVERLALQNEGAAVGQATFDDAYRQFMDTGKHESHQAAALATMVRERYIAKAAALGTGQDPDALYLRDQVQISGPGALARVRRGDLDVVIARLKSGETVQPAKTPVLDIVRKAGGVRTGSQLDAELRAMGVTPKTHPGLFKKTGGIGDVDNFVLSEHDVLRDNGIPDSGNGYADRDAVLEALRVEAGGRGAALLTQDEREQRARLDEPVSVLAEQLDAAGLDPNAMTADEIKAWATGQQTAVPADTQGVLLQAQEAGYQGADIGEAAEWLSAAAKGLDMSTEARMARAEAMGFTTDAFHGTNADFSEFGKTADFIGFHVGLTSNQAEARTDTYGDEGQRILPLRVRAGKQLDMPEMGSWYPVKVARQLEKQKIAPKGFADRVWKAGGKPHDDSYATPEQMAAMGAMVREQVQAAGYDSIRYDNAVEGPGHALILLDPSQARSRFAAFDPDRAGEAGLLFQSVYHGSPHVFDKFSTAAIGSGEGHQAFGFGLYFAGKKEIAQYYRETLAGPQMTWDGEPVTHRNIDAVERDVVKALGEEGRRLTMYLWGAGSVAELRRKFPELEISAKAEKYLNKHLKSSPGGRLYTVEIPDDGEYLLYDKPLSEQPEAVQQRLRRLVDHIPKPGLFTREPMKSMREALHDGLSARNLPDMTGEELYSDLSSAFGRNERAASEALLAAGVRGIKYLDASARDSSGDSFNYVLFADSDVVIQSYEQAAAGGARGSYQRMRDPYGNLSNVIRLTEGANLSTALHEFGHFFLFQLIDDATLPGATPEARVKLQADLQAVLDHLGIKVDVATSSADQVHAAMTREAHELWARSFEVYAREGRAPSAALRDAFASFAAWLVRIYRTLRDIPDYRKKLTPEVRGVMDRLLATEDAIKDAQASSSFRVPSALRSVMTAAEQKSLEKLTAQANMEAREELTKRVMKELERERLEWWKEERAKVRERVEADVRSRPVYRAYNLIRTGQTADGGQLVDENGNPRAMKLDRNLLERDYGKDITKLLPKGLTAKDGASHHVVASWTGFGSADELRDALLNLQPIKEVVEAETDAAMKQRHGDMISGIAEDAAEVVLNEKQLELAGLQAKALRRLAASVMEKAAQRKVAETGAKSAATDRAAVLEAQADEEAVATTGIPAEGVAGVSAEAQMAAATAAASVGQRTAQRAALRQTRGVQSGLDVKAITAAAKKAIAGKRIEDAVPGRYRAQADRLGRQIEQAIAARDYAKAATLKEQQLINLALAREAQEVQASVGKALKRFGRLRKPDSKLGKSTDIEFVGAARAILSKFGLSSPQVGFDQQVWFEKLAEQSPAGAAQLRSMIDAATAGAGQVAARGRTRTRAKPGGAPTAMGDVWRQMTVDEFRSLTDTVDAILSNGRDARSVQLGEERVEIKAASDELLAQASGRDTGKRIGQTQAVTDAEKRTRSFWAMAAFLERTEAWVRRMDDGKVGPFTRRILQPVLAAIYPYRAAKTGRVKQMVDILAPRKAELLGKPIHSNELNYTFSNKGELLHALLHSGNDSNFRKLLLGGRGKGYAWGKVLPDGSLDTSRWDSMIRRMVQEGVLTKADYDTAQQVWDLLEELKGPAQIAHRKMFGFYFEEVEVTGINTPFGKYRGGYAPAISDRRLNPEAGARVDANAMGELENAGILPTVAKGFTKSRVEYNQPLELNISKLVGHMDTVLKFTYLGPVIRDVTRLVTNREFRAGMFGIDPHAIDEVLVPWLQRVARQTTEIPFTSEGARTFGKFFKALQRNTGIAAMAGNVLNAAQQVTGLSVAMAEVRPTRVLRGLVSSIGAPQQSSQMIMQKSAYMADRMNNSTQELMTTLDDLLTDKSRFRKLRDKTDKHGYFAQIFMQNLVDRAVWLGGYEQGIAKGLTEGDAVLGADAVVRQTQGSFAPEDVSRVEVQNAFARPFVQFYSYFNAQFNFLRTKFDSTVQELGWVGGSPRLFYIYVMGAMVPAVLADAMMQAATGQLGDDDDDGLIDDIGELFAMSQIRYFAAQVPVVGTLVNFGIHLANDKPYDDRLSVAPVVSQAERIGGTIVKLATGKESTTGRAVQDALMLISMIFGLPLAQLGKPLGYFTDVATGEQQGETVGDWIRGTLTGREAPPK